MGSGINIALPVIGREFNADAILLNWMITAFQLSVVAFILPFGRLADIIGIKKMIIYGMILYTITSVLCGFSSSMTMLIIFRSMQGVGGAMMFGTFTALLTTIYPAEGRGRALGISTATIYIGLSAGPFLAGLITEHLSWRIVFFIMVPAYLFATLLILLKIKGDWSGARGEKFDTSGSIIYTLAMVALMYGFSQLPHISGAALAAAGIIGIFGFIWWENRTQSPILNVKLFRDNKVLLFSNIATLVNYCSSAAVAFLMSLYLQYIKALTPDQAGLIILAQPTAQALFSPLTGRLSDRIEPRIIASAGMMLTFIGLILFCFLSNGTSLATIVIILIMLGTGIACFTSPNTNAVMSSVAPKYYGAVASANGTMRNVGMLMSMAITMVVMAMMIGGVAITPDYYPAFLASARTAFIIFSVICFGGIFASLYRGKIRRDLV
jgi:EmrB/QacA subfamily drug resistance transporter